MRTKDDYLNPDWLCLSCQHFDFGPMDNLTCRAFPKAIPDKILMGEEQHRNHIPGDNDLKYTPRKDDDE